MYKIKIYSSKNFDNKEFQIYAEQFYEQDRIFYFFREKESNAFFWIPVNDAIVYVVEKIKTP